ncbi:hypothetical protein HOY82DRAFT_541352 [Tuber indicum]|nr:hypothetical protein HOY82DRAFT_541352 [Tuber indicum]
MTGDIPNLRLSTFMRSYVVLGRVLAKTKFSSKLSVNELFVLGEIYVPARQDLEEIANINKESYIRSRLPMENPPVPPHPKSPEAERRSSGGPPILFEIDPDAGMNPPSDPILLEALRTYDIDTLEAFSEKPTNSTEVAEAYEVEPEGHRRKRTRLTTDPEKAYLIRLCINNFGRYGMGRDKFFSSIGHLYEQEKNTPAPDVKSWMIRRENERRKEIEEAKGSSGRAVAASEFAQAMDVWLTMVSDWDTEEKKKKAVKGESDKGKKSVTALREKMCKTITERRQEEEKSTGEETNKKGTRMKDRSAVSSISEGSNIADKAFASQRRTVDRVLSTLRESDETAMKQLVDMDERRWERDTERWKRTEQIEVEKVALLRELLQSQGSSSGQEEGEYFNYKKGVESLNTRVGILETQGQQLQEQIEQQGKETGEKLDAILNVLKEN